MAQVLDFHSTMSALWFALACIKCKTKHYWLVSIEAANTLHKTHNNGRVIYNHIVEIRELILQSDVETVLRLNQNMWA